MDIVKTIGNNISTLMDNAEGLDTCKKLAFKSGVSYGTIQRAKNGEINITVQNLAAIASAFKLHPADLLFESTDKRKAAISDYAVTTEGTTTHYEVKEPSTASILPMPEPLMSELVEIAAQLNDRGLIQLIERAKAILEEHPKAHKGKHSSSQ